jgi:hypothetical protein
MEVLLREYSRKAAKVMKEKAFDHFKFVLVFMRETCCGLRVKRGIISNGVKYTRIPICSAGAF